MFDLREAGNVTVGARFRAQSGIPVTALGNHSAYGRQESFLLPRGEYGRTDFENNIDLHAAYARKLGSSMELELYAEIFNLLNNQQQVGVDNEYTVAYTDPIVGGTKEDLYYLKAENAILGLGGSTGNPAAKQLNFRNTNARQSPLAARIGLTLTF